MTIHQKTINECIDELIEIHVDLNGISDNEVEVITDRLQTVIESLEMLVRKSQ